MLDIDGMVRAKQAYKRAVAETPPSQQVEAISNVLALVTSGCNNPRSLDWQVQAVLWARDVVMRGGRT